MFNNKGKAKLLARFAKEKKADGMMSEVEDEGEAMESEGGGMDAPGMLCQLLGMLLAMRQNYHSSHWQVSGPNFYGDHLLFEKLYGSVSEDIDTLAEKMVAKYGSHMVNASKLSQIQAQVVMDLAQHQDAVQRGLASEKALQALTKSTYHGLKESGQLSLGMDDFLMAMANTHEENEYLLGQRSGGTGGGTAVVSMLRKSM